MIRGSAARYCSRNSYRPDGLLKPRYPGHGPATSPIPFIYPLPRVLGVVGYVGHNRIQLLQAAGSRAL